MEKVYYKMSRIWRNQISCFLSYLLPLSMVLVFRTHMLASLLVRPKISNLRLKCCFYLIRTAAPTLWICSLVACIGTVFSIYSAYTLKLPFRTACLNMKSCVERVVLGFSSETLMGIFVKLFLFWFFFTLIEMFCCGQDEWGGQRASRWECSWRLRCD